MNKTKQAGNCGFSGSDAREEVLRTHGGLVRTVAGRYRARGAGVGLEMEDLMQEGTLALLCAHDGFDSSRGFKFSTYATSIIDRTIRKAIRDYEFLRLPQQAHSLLRQIEAFVSRFFAEHGEEPTDEQIEEGLSVADSERALLRLLLDLRRRGYFETPPCSLDAPVGESGDITIGDLLTYSPYSTLPMSQIRDWAA